VGGVYYHMTIGQWGVLIAIGMKVETKEKEFAEFTILLPL
jgi:hypothetical protein